MSKDLERLGDEPGEHVGRKPFRGRDQPVQSHVLGTVDMAMNESFQWMETY